MRALGLDPDNDESALAGKVNGCYIILPVNYPCKRAPRPAANLTTYSYHLHHIRNEVLALQISQVLAENTYYRFLAECSQTSLESNNRPGVPEKECPSESLLYFLVLPVFAKTKRSSSDFG
jgi:hypothetical protein